MPASGLAAVLTRLPAAAAGTATAADGKSNGNAVANVVLVVAIVLVAGFLLLSSRRRARAQQAGRRPPGPGSRVVTRAGLLATVVTVEDDAVTLEIAPGVHARFVPEAIGRVLQEAGDEPSADDAPKPPTSPGDADHQAD